jgi:hypothetical protein
LFESHHHGWLFQHGGAVLLGFSRRHIANGLQQQTILNPPTDAGVVNATITEERTVQVD